MLHLLEEFDLNILSSLMESSCLGLVLLEFHYIMTPFFNTTFLLCLIRCDFLVFAYLVWYLTIINLLNICSMFYTFTCRSYLGRILELMAVVDILISMGMLRKNTVYLLIRNLHYYLQFLYWCHSFASLSMQNYPRYHPKPSVAGEDVIFNKKHELIDSVCACLQNVFPMIL